MIFSTSLLFLPLLAEAVSGTPISARVRSPYAVKDSHFVPRKWSRVGPAPADHTINLHIGLKQSQFDELERRLFQAQVNELVKPTDNALELVHDWLLDNGVELSHLDHSPAKDWIKVSLPVNAVEGLLDTEYSIFKHEDGSHIVRTPSWSLPAHLHEHIDAIQPTNSFFRAEPRRTNWRPAGRPEHGMEWNYPPQMDVSNVTVAQVCNASAVTPLCLRTLYRTIGYTPQAAGTNRIGLTDYLGEANNKSDVQLFLSKFRPDAVGGDFAVEVIDNGDNQQTPNTPAQLAAGKDLEGNLDAETVLAIDYPTPLVAYTTGGAPPFVPDAFTPTDTNEPYLAWVSYVLAQASVPQVISTSYADDEQTVPAAYARRVCSEFAQLGARGVSLLFASGDRGVGRTGACLTNDGRNASTFLPSFPSTCPYVTSVGGTKAFAPEVVAYDARNGFAPGGGFSNYFPQPWWQTRAVDAYVTGLAGRHDGLYNKTGRAYPDLAAQAQHFVTVWNGSEVLLDGTSASTPAAAAVIALVNDALLARGKPPLGFLNPWLYRLGFKGLNDIISGSAIGCGGDGFPAEAGWDAVTGWGTPDFLKLKALAGAGGEVGRQWD
ncbi:hypothetical protein B0A49_00609 [Cryomyces minteri]|uniref:tripeptidyl-peptidase II n=1 Tax=Cryomyces minteri TaxID=331657 RepID=A0A4U0XVD7_9PEZI|nr:hypothetical protein B0A49_00609 [Cryomyces minteri]